MAYRLRTHESVAEGLKRIVKKEIGEAVRQLTESGSGDEAVHEARKSVRRFERPFGCSARKFRLGARRSTCVEPVVSSRPSGTRKR